MNISKVEYDSYTDGGCPTCDYGANYIDNVKIIFDDETFIEFHSEIINKEVLSESDWMVILGRSNTKEDIINQWKQSFNSYTFNSSDVYYKEGLVWSNESTVHYTKKDGDIDE